MTSAKLLVSALAVTLLTTPGFAQNPSAKYRAQAIANAAVVDGTIVGADPDARIRSALQREWDSRYGE